MLQSTDRSTDDRTDTNTDRSSSRREFLGLTAAVGGTVLAGCSSSDSGSSEPTEMTTESPMPTATASPTPTPTETEQPTEQSTEEPMTTNPDVPILNYALTLEHLENVFYRRGLEEFGDDEFMQASSLSKFDERIRMEVPGYLETVGSHEAAHVRALTDTIEQLGGMPVEEGEYEFGFGTPSEFLKIAMALENTGVAAYAGAAPKVVNNDILAAAAGIHSVEARHASFLNLINSQQAFPKAVDNAKSLQEVLNIAGQFITSEVDPSRYQRGDDAMPPLQRKAKNETTDIDVLNYALTLEHLENAFYREGLEEFSDTELMEADVVSDFDEYLKMQIPKHLTMAGAHEKAHVNALTATVKKLGGEPVSEASYDFGYETPSEFLGVAKALENTGVAAYKGAAPTVSNDTVFAAAIGIHSVEARHAAFLNELNATVPFPKGVDAPKSMQEVTDVASQFIVSN